MKVPVTTLLALLIAATCFAMFSILSLSAQSRRPGEYRMTGPYVHENLAVFLIHGQSRTIRHLIALEQAVAEHKIVVYETRNVNELAIENVSTEDIFIESGDIVKG